MHTHYCGIQIRASEDRQVCQHHGFLLDERGVDNRDGFVDLHLAFPLGSQATNPPTAKDWLSCYARTGSIVSHIKDLCHRRY